jgi:hypothetical protein
MRASRTSGYPDFVRLGYCGYSYGLYGLVLDGSRRPAHDRVALGERPGLRERSSRDGDLGFVSPRRADECEI